MRVIDANLSSYDKDADAHYARLSSPSSVQRLALTRLVTELKQTGMWDLLDGLCVNGGSVANTMLNVKDPTIDCVYTGSPTMSGGVIQVGYDRCVAWDQGWYDFNQFTNTDGWSALYVKDQCEVSSSRQLHGFYYFQSAQIIGSHHLRELSGNFEYNWFYDQDFGLATATGYINANSVVSMGTNGSTKYMRVNDSLNLVSLGTMRTGQYNIQHGVVGTAVYQNPTHSLANPAIGVAGLNFGVYGWWIGKFIGLTGDATIKAAIDNYNSMMGIS